MGLTARVCSGGGGGAVSLLLLLLALLAVLGARVPAAEARRIVAVGDLHGDLNQSKSVLRLARVIDERANWIAEDALLVQTGDVLDGGPDDLLIVEMLMALQKQAHAKGGDVVQLLGNHEMRNLRGDFKAVDADSLAAQGGQAGRERIMSVESPIGKYLRSRDAIFRYGPFLFMHGGFSTATARVITSVKKIDEFNRELKKALVNGTISPLAKNGLNLDEDVIDDVANPILVRSILNVKCDDLTRELRRKFGGIQSVVVGHVPHDPRDFDDWRLCGGALIDIDFGMSRWKKGDPGHVAALEIEQLEDGRWHTQLVEATVAYVDPAGAQASAAGSNLARLQRYYRRNFVRLTALLVVLLLSLGMLIVMCCTRRRVAPKAPLGDQADAVDYGSTI